MQQPVMDLVAVAYQAPEATEAFLGSLVHVGLPFTLSVIENNSPDQEVRDLLLGPALDFVRHLDMCTEVRVILNQENVGYARAINAGAAMGSAPYLAALNCDIRFLQDYDVCHDVVVHMQEHPDVGIIGPRTVDQAERLTHAGIVANSRGNNEQHRFWLHRDIGQASDVLDVPTVSGATYFVRRATWEQLTLCEAYQSVAPDADGAFLPTPHFYEETWCSYHARLHGWRVVYLGNTKMVHLWHQSSPVGSQDIITPREYFLRALTAHEMFYATQDLA